MIRHIVLVLACSVEIAAAQDLVPGAYTPAPVGFNVVTVAATMNKGDVTFEPSLPVEEAHATIGLSSVSLGRTIGFYGHYANVGVGVPLMSGRLEGLVNGQFQSVSRAGVGDLVARFAVNVYGTPALSPQQFARYRPTTVVALGVSAGVPVGQYDHTRAINIGTNRWFVKSEAGISRTRNRWTFEADLGATVFTDNTDYREGGVREQSPIVSAQGHLIYTVRPGFWVAGDGNFWHGGRVTINGAPGVIVQKNSRLGLTAALPIKRHQIRIAYSFGAFTTIGGDYQSIGVSYSYAWAGRP